MLWDRYVQLTQIEAAFKCLKSDLGIRPIHHQLEHRVDAHILVAFLAYCLTVTLRHRLRMHAPGLTPRAVLEKLAGIQMLDVSFPTTDGRRLIMPRYTEPDPEQALLLHHLNLVLPQQPPPRITTSASSDSLSPTENVVETFGVPLLKTNGRPASDRLNCEGSVRLIEKGFDDARRQAKPPAPPRAINSWQALVGQAFSLPGPFSTSS